jgi:hypothetical protein
MLVEDPKLVILLGIVSLAVLASLLHRTERYGLVFLGMAGVLVLTVAGVLVERFVVTEREEVEAVVDGLAAALEANDVEGVMQYLSPSAEHTRSRARWAMGQIIVLDTGVRHLEITINRLTSPTTAEIRFDGTIRYDYKNPGIGRNFYAARFVVLLEQQDGRWLVTDHLEQTMAGL